MAHIAKVIEIIGSSDKGWEDAAQVAVDEARKDVAWNTWNRSYGYDCNSR